MNKNFIFGLILAMAALGLIMWGVLFKKQETQVVKKNIPIFGPYDINQNNDTVYHTIPGFSFINQDGKLVTEKDFAGSIYVADYFFTTCQSICPIMSTQMQRVYNNFKGNNRVKFLSHTVDPETDSVSVLKQYANEHNANASQWMFVTGSKPALYEQARKGYFLDAEEGNGGPEDFIHTQNFALIDNQRHIRGYYNGTDSLDINKMIADINVLLEEVKQ